MPFEIVRNDITNMHVEAIVNTANSRPVIGLGVDSMIHEKAGPNLLKARQKIGSIDMGCAAITPAFNLHAKYVKLISELSGSMSSMISPSGLLQKRIFKSWEIHLTFP